MKKEIKRSVHVYKHILSVSWYLLEPTETDFLFPEKANYHSLNGAHYVISRFILIFAYSPLIRIDHDNY